MPFQKIPYGEDIRAVIASAFDTTLDVSGEWGYEQEKPLVIERTDMPLMQMEHTLASMRAFIEMNLTQPPEKRYGAINVNELRRECLTENNRIYDKIEYEISGMLEYDYEKLIDEYKAGYGKPEFDMQAHFEKRKACTVVRREVFWFDITDVNKT